MRVFGNMEELIIFSSYLSKKNIVYNLDFLVDFWRVRGLCQCDPLSLMLFVIVMRH